LARPEKRHDGRSLESLLQLGEARVSLDHGERLP
jgi:hypothetical protein